MTRSDLIEELAARFHQLTQRDAEQAVKTILEAIEDSLVRGPRIDEQDNAGRYLQLMRIDKKSEAGEIRFVLIDGPGKAVVLPAPDALVREVIDACCE